MKNVSDIARERVVQERYRECDEDLLPQATIEHADRKAGAEIVMGNGGWWLFMVTVSPNARSPNGYAWLGSVVLDDGQNGKRTGVAATRGDAHAEARFAVRDMMSLWAQVRTRVRKCQNKLNSEVELECYVRPLPPPDLDTLWRRLLRLFRDETPEIKRRLDVRVWNRVGNDWLAETQDREWRHLRSLGKGGST